VAQVTAPIVARERVKRAVDDALNGSCHGDQEKAIAYVAAAQCLPEEAVRLALQPADFWCCEKGENLGVPVCDDCAEFDELMRAAWSEEHGESPLQSQR
jgi:hypothetical protein